MNELEEYYNSEIYEQGMPDFANLEHWQRSQMSNSGHFHMWKTRRSFEAFMNSVYNALHIPDIVAWLSGIFK